jgi:hypothetical protein
MMEFFPKTQYLQTFMTELFVEPAGVREMKDDMFMHPRRRASDRAVDPGLLEKYTVQKS